MGTLALLKLKHKDIGALFAFCLLGFLAACLIPDPTWAVYTSILVADHLFLGWLLFMGDENARRQLPVAAILAIHLAFVLLVIGLVASRHHIPYFNLLPWPLAGVGVWILSSAAGVESQDDDTEELRRHRAAARAARRAELQSSLQARVAAREAQHPTPARHPRPKPARSASRPAANSRSHKPAAPASSSQITSHSATHASAQKSQPAVAATPPANLGVFAEAQPEVDFDAIIAAINALQPGQLFAEAHPVMAAAPVTESAISASPAPAVSALQQSPVVAQPQHEAATQAAPISPGLAAELRPLVETPHEKPVFLRDNSIAESIRQKPPEELARLYPILSATAEDHEEWLKERGSRNPTHRKLGLTVREEYEHWLMARAAARNDEVSVASAGGPAAP